MCVGPADGRLHVQRPGPLRPGRGHRLLARLRRHARGGRQVSEDLGEVYPRLFLRGNIFY